MQGVIALLLGSAGGLLIWAVLAQRKVSKLRSKYAPINNAEEEAFINQAISLKTDDIHLLEVGYYEAGYEFEDLPAYEAALRRIREEQKQMLRIDGSEGDRSAAAFCSETIRFNESVSQGRSMIKKILKLMLRAFNGECDSYIARVNYKNISAMEKRIETSHEQINRLGESWYCSISNRYLENRIEELRLSYSYEEAKQKEKEEQALIREQMREEEKAIREIEKAREQAENDKAKYADMLEKAKAEAQQATDQDKQKLNEKIIKLEALLAEAEAKRQRAISRAQMTRSGYVYVISNVGSFGEHVYKIGMTRRDKPLDRVRELGDEELILRTLKRNSSESQSMRSEMNCTRSTKRKALKQNFVSHLSPKQSSTDSVKQSVGNLSVPILLMSLDVCHLRHRPPCSEKMTHWRLRELLIPRSSGQ